MIGLRSLIIKVSIFVIIGLTMGVVEYNTLTGPHVGSTHTYHALFGGTDGVSGLHAGNPVRVSGVPVGKVTGVTLLDASHVRITFTANNDQQLTTNTWAVVRYADLLGQRYLEARQVHGEPPLPRDDLGQVDREAEGVVELEGLGAGDRLRA